MVGLVPRLYWCLSFSPRIPRDLCNGSVMKVVRKGEDFTGSASKTCFIPVKNSVFERPNALDSPNEFPEIDRS